MKKLKPVLLRLKPTSKQTLGRLFIFNDMLDIKFSCFTLELPWRDNKRNISRIAPGIYPIRFRYSKKHKEHIEVLDVDGRSLILMHVLNFYTQTEGCIGVGRSLANINSDNELDISSSRQTLTNLMFILKDQKDMKIEIVDVLS